MSDTKNIYLISPCPVCGLEEECPHTPVRCQHNWKYEMAKFPNFEVLNPGERRTCYGCGRIERAAGIKWETIKP